MKITVTADIAVLSNLSQLRQRQRTFSKMRAAARPMLTDASLFCCARMDASTAAGSSGVPAYTAVISGS
jgi:hypothetical protein